MSNSLSSRVIGAGEAEARLPESQRERSIALFQHGTLTVKLCAPRGSDPQTPHTRDEIYVVIRGTGDFICAGERRKFAAHDFLLSPPEWNIALKISAMILRSGFSSTARKAARQRRDLAGRCVSGVPLLM